jgi:uncharacterized protein
MPLDWMKKNAPRREEILSLGFVRPFAHWLRHGALWHFNRRSVTRGVLVGLLFAFIIPFIQSIPALLLAVPMRANLAVTVLSTWLTNPFTAGIFTPLAYAIGKMFMPNAKPLADLAPPASESWISWYLDWGHVQEAASLLVGPWFVGTLVLGVAASLLGYLLTDLAFRLAILRRWRKRQRRRAA